jgi:hypothetical protein
MNKTATEITLHLREDQKEEIKKMLEGGTLIGKKVIMEVGHKSVGILGTIECEIKSFNKKEL